MALLKEFLLDINKKISIPGIEALAGASDLAAIEIDDDTMTQANTKLNGLMSIDAAQNNPELETHFKNKLTPKLKGELLGNVDTDIHQAAKELFGEDALEKFKEIEFTGEKAKLLGKLAKEKIEKAPGVDPEIKKINDGLNQKILDLTKGHDKSLKEKEKEISKMKQGFTNTLIHKEYEAKFNTYNLGDKYTDDFVKNALKDEIYKKASEKAKFTLSEDGKVIPRNLENDTLELYIEGQKIEDIKGILDPLMKPYVKANNVTKPGPHGTYTPSTEPPKARMAIDMIQKKAHKKAQMN